jgi:predicted DNA-binding transcriptional regulator AlpA
VSNASLTRLAGGTGNGVLEMSSPGRQEEEPPNDARARQWPVAIQLSLQAAGTCTILPHTYERIAEALNGVAPVFSIGQGSLGIRFRVVAPDYREAQVEASEALARVLLLLRLPSEAVAGVTVGNMLSESEAPPIGQEFVGVGEAAEILGVTKQRVHQLTKRPDFPMPVFRLKATPVWSESEIREYQARRARLAH